MLLFFLVVLVFRCFRVSGFLVFRVQGLQGFRVEGSVFWV